MSQLDFTFMPSAEASGFDRWQEQRIEAMRVIAHKLDLPIGHAVEVWLKDNVRLRGVLRLREELLFLPEGGESSLQLIVDNVAFTVGEMESCVRTD